MASIGTFTRIEWVFLRLFLALGPLICGVALAGTPEQDKRCAERVVDLAITTDFTDGLARPTVEFTGRFRGQHGGNRLKLERGEFHPWISSYAKYRFDMRFHLTPIALVNVRRQHH